MVAEDLSPKHNYLLLQMRELGVKQFNTAYIIECYLLVFSDYIDNMVTNFKAPPLLTDESVYENWKREIEIWQAFTDVAPKKQGSTIFLTLQGKAREAALEIEIKDLTDDQGVKKLIEKLDSLFLEDKNQSAYATYESFEMYRRPKEMNMKEFLNNFECLYNKLKVYQMELPDEVLAYSVLKSTNLSEENEKFPRATITTLTHKSMTEQLKKIIGDMSKSLSQQFYYFYLKSSKHLQKHVAHQFNWVPR